MTAFVPTASARTEPFGQPVQIVRWGTTLITAVMCMPAIFQGRRSVLVAFVVVAAYNAARTVNPIRDTGDDRTTAVLVAEALTVSLAAAWTGFWESPLVFSMVPVMVIAGFVTGLARGMRLAGSVVVGLTAASLLHHGTLDVAARANEASVLLVAVTLIAAYARRIFGEAQRQHTQALDRLGRLNDANTLLHNLHQVAQTLPASLDLDEVLDQTVTTLRDLFRVDVAAVLLFDELDGSLRVHRRLGAHLPVSFEQAELPAPVERARRLRTVVHVPKLAESGGPGVAGSARSGLYSILTARGTEVGALVVESEEDFAFEGRHADLLAGFAEPAALAIDNARWFARLRTVGADEERTRIARDLHDRIGQSLAYLAFELDRILKKEGAGDAVTQDLGLLREDVRGVVREVRDTLYDLRTDVSPDTGVETVLEEFLDRVGQRSGVEVFLDCEDHHRLPLNQERELWRIAQEAVVNAERHARARCIEVTWRSDPSGGMVEVRDDGIGFPVGRSGRFDSYGLLGMRERAVSVGATLEVDSEPGRGTKVRAAITVAERSRRDAPVPHLYAVGSGRTA